MKKMLKAFGVIAFIAVIGFTMAACEDAKEPPETEEGYIYINKFDIKGDDQPVKYDFMTVELTEKDGVKTFVFGVKKPIEGKVLHGETSVKFEVIKYLKREVYYLVTENTSGNFYIGPLTATSNILDTTVGNVKTRQTTYDSDTTNYGNKKALNDEKLRLLDNLPKVSVGGTISSKDFHNYANLSDLTALK